MNGWVGDNFSLSHPSLVPPGEGESRDSELEETRVPKPTSCNTAQVLCLTPVHRADSPLPVWLSSAMTGIVLAHMPNMAESDHLMLRRGQPS